MEIAQTHRHRIGRSHPVDKGRRWRGRGRPRLSVGSRRVVAGAGLAHRCVRSMTKLEQSDRRSTRARLGDPRRHARREVLSPKRRRRCRRRRRSAPLRTAIIQFLVICAVRMQEADDEPAKRHCDNTTTTPPISLPPPQAWPTTAELYERGLECKAEAATSSQTWSVNSRDWRSAAFASADSDGARLKQRQSELRRMMLQKPAAEIDANPAAAAMDDAPT